MTANEVWDQKQHNSSPFDFLIDALNNGVCCTIGELTLFNSVPVTSSKRNAYSAKISHRKHNHGEIIEAIVLVKLSKKENLLRNHVDTILQLSNMEYIYKDCSFAINDI